MTGLTVILLVLLVGQLKGQVEVTKSQHIVSTLDFPGPEGLSISNYVMFNVEFPGAESGISVCTWFRKYLDSTSPHVFFSYATTRTPNEIALPDDLSYLDPNIGQFTTYTWYHYCCTLDFNSSLLDVVINGAQVLESPIPEGSSLKTSGTLVLGQEQDAIGNDFDLTQAFAGQLHDLNVYNRRLMLDEIGALASERCGENITQASLEESLILSWSEILQQAQHGQVSLARSECTEEPRDLIQPSDRGTHVEVRFYEN